jgi:hypothetical protein
MRERTYGQRAADLALSMAHLKAAKPSRAAPRCMRAAGLTAARAGGSPPIDRRLFRPAIPKNTRRPMPTAADILIETLMAWDVVLPARTN